MVEDDDLEFDNISKESRLSSCYAFVILKNFLPKSSSFSILSSLRSSRDDNFHKVGKDEILKALKIMSFVKLLVRDIVTSQLGNWVPGYLN